MPRLTLTRKQHERVIVTVPPSSERTRIVLEVALIAGERVRLAVEAPAEVIVNREEIEAQKAGGGA